MTRRTIEHEDEQMVVGVSLGELFKERLQAPTVHPRKIETDVFSRFWLDRRVKVATLVGAADEVGRALEAQRTGLCRIMDLNFAALTY
jgi:hypothetical protein